MHTSMKITTRAIGPEWVQMSLSVNPVPGSGVWARAMTSISISNMSQPLDGRAGPETMMKDGARYPIEDAPSSAER